MARSSTDYPDDIWDRLDFVTVLKKRKIAPKIKKTSDLVKCTFDDTLTLPGRRRQLKRSLIYSIKIPSFKYPLRLLWLKPCVLKVTKQRRTLFMKNYLRRQTIVEVQIAKQVV